MILRSKVVVSVFVAAATVAACQSSDSDPTANAGGAPGAGDGGRSGSPSAGAGHTPGGRSGAGAPATGDAGADGEPNPYAGSGGQGAHAGGGGRNAGSGGPNAGSGGANAGSAGEAAAGEAGSDGQAGSDGEGGSPDSSGEVAYLGTVLTGLFTSSVDPVSGKPTQVGAALAKTSNIAALAVDPSQRFLYVAAEQKHLDVYRIGADGTLPATPSSTVATPDMLNSLTLDPQGRFAYASSVPGSEIYGYKIDPNSGALTSIGAPIAVGDATHGGANYVAEDPTGRYLYVSYSFGGGINGYEINATSGALTLIAGSPFVATGLPSDQNVFGGAIVIKPSGDFLYSAGFALNAFKIAAGGKLELVAGSPFTLDIQSDPDATNLALDPQGKYLYSTHFFGNNHIHGFKIDQANGSLAPVPNSPITGTTPYSVAVDPSGRFLYVGVDEANGLDAYTIDRSNGSLTRVEGAPYTIGGLEPVIAFVKLPRP